MPCLFESKKPILEPQLRIEISETPGEFVIWSSCNGLWAMLLPMLDRKICSDKKELPFRYFFQMDQLEFVKDFVEDFIRKHKLLSLTDTEALQKQFESVKSRLNKVQAAFGL